MSFQKGNQAGRMPTQTAWDYKRTRHMARGSIIQVYEQNRTRDTSTRTAVVVEDNGGPYLFIRLQRHGNLTAEHGRWAPMPVRISRDLVIKKIIAAAVKEEDL